MAFSRNLESFFDLSEGVEDDSLEGFILASMGGGSSFSRALARSLGDFGHPRPTFGGLCPVEFLLVAAVLLVLPFLLRRNLRGLWHILL